MHDESTYYRGHLPHFQPSHATFFVTFRLAGSLPSEDIGRLREERQAIEKSIEQCSKGGSRRDQLYELTERYFGKFDGMLDRNEAGPHWLGEPKIADLVAEAIQYRDGRVYRLFAFCIMPNHVHLVVSLGERRSAVGRADCSTYNVTDILENLKWYTALKANRLLNRTGQFWQHESYDHVVREGQLERIVAYMLDNPVQAGLARTWQEWKWAYVCREIFEDMFDSP